MFANDLITSLITSFECNIPILTASGLMSFAVNNICLEISFGEIGTIEDTPVVF